MLEKIQIVKQRFDEVNDLIIQPDIIADQKRYVQLNKEYKDFRIKDIKLKEEEVEEGEGIGYLTPNAFGKKKKNVYTSQYGYKLVPKKIKGSGIIVKQLFETNVNLQV